jgi:flavorubredoxin
MKYFSNCKNLEDLKKEYRKLALKYHPDRNSGTDTTKIMQSINAEYEKMFEILQSESNNTYEKQENVNDFMEVINKIINLNVNIEICGVYIWISGNTYTVKEQLKQAGFYWASKKCMWYWKPEEVTSSKHKTWDMEKIRNKYGSQLVKEAGNIAAHA